MGSEVFKIGTTVRGASMRELALSAAQMERTMPMGRFSQWLTTSNLANNILRGTDIAGKVVTAGIALPLAAQILTGGEVDATDIYEVEVAAAETTAGIATAGTIGLYQGYDEFMTGSDYREIMGNIFQYQADKLTFDENYDRRNIENLAQNFHLRAVRDIAEEEGLYNDTMAFLEENGYRETQEMTEAVAGDSDQTSEENINDLTA
jgi:hypothetical protein